MMNELLNAIEEFQKAIKTFNAEYASMRKELKDVSDIVASQDKRIEQLEMLVHNG